MTLPHSLTHFLCALVVGGVLTITGCDVLFGGGEAGGGETDGDDSQIVFDDFEDGLQDEEYFTFAGNGAAIALSAVDDVPAESGGSTALQAAITGAETGFAGFGKNESVGLADLGADPHINFYVKTDASQSFTLEVNLQEDQDGNGAFDGSGSTDDEFQFNYAVQPGGEDYTLVSLPLSAFFDDNSVNSGGDGQLSDRIAAVVFAIGNLTSASYTLSVDDIVFSAESLGGDGAGTGEDDGDGDAAEYELVFEDNFDTFDEAFWDRGDHTFDGNLAHFRPENVTVEDGKLILTLRKEDFQGREYTGGELRTDNQDGFYQYGRFETRMKSAGPSGTISSFFSFRYNPWQEIDFEILGKNNRQVSLNIFYNDGPEGAQNNDAFEVPPFPQAIDVDFDASEGFHVYAFEWEPGELRWYVDGELVRRTTAVGVSPDQIPNLPTQIMMNLWVSEFPEFSGEIDDSDFPVQSEYDYVRFYEKVEE